MMSGINKVKKFFIKVVAFIGLALLPVGHLYAEVYMNTEQAKEVLWQATAMSPVAIVLTNDQMDAIEDASGIWVGNENLKAWKTETGGWFIIDQVVGKHEMIDLAVALTNEGKVKGIEVLQYREAYGSGVKHPKWLAQFLGKDHTEHLQLGNQIHNLSGGTLSSRHIMEGVTRLVHTWNQVLRHL
jgi:Na+-translocating ferredoxin:NAD+ oxidoreductase RnfG subunit|tara:strand:- start:228 stop:782 length:555 start_codon:yes stop_codon:yes gene_type:complete